MGIERNIIRMRNCTYPNCHFTPGEADMNNCLETPQTIPAGAQKSIVSCRLCGTSLASPFLDLGQQPLCESFLQRHELNQMEPFFPLHVYVCRECMLVQLDQY